MTTDLLLGRYELHRLLGRGGMAEVWDATDTRLGRRVAVKTVNLAAAHDRTVGERLQREAVSIAALKHPDIVTVYDAGVEGDIAYLVMELVEGIDLAAVVREGPLPVPEALRVGARVAGALAAAHQAGIVHRDIKPANVLLHGDGVTVVDFGIAVAIQAAGASLTEAGTVIGTADYMAPEQAEGGDISPATDVYALGCLVTTVIAGRPPFTGEHPLEVLRQHVAAPPPRLATLAVDVPPDLDTLVAAMLAKDPAERPAAAAVSQALQDLRERGSTGVVAALGGATEVLPTDGETRRLPQAGAPVREQESPTTERPRRRAGWLVAGAVALLAAAVVVASALLDGGDPSVGGGETAPAAGEETTAPETWEPTEPEASPAETAPPETAEPTDPTDDRGMEGLLASLDAEEDVREDLQERWDEVVQAIDEGEPDQVADKARDFSQRVDELAREGEISQADEEALQAELEAAIGGPVPFEDEDEEDGEGQGNGGGNNGNGGGNGDRGNGDRGNSGNSGNNGNGNDD